jgi:hypothetical protein
VSRPRRPLAATALATVVLVLALVTAGCGGDDEATGTVTVPATTAPMTTSSTTTAPPTAPATTPTTTAPTTTSQPPTTTTEPDPSQPDSKRNDTKGDPNTPEGAFDEACQRNPESCG